VAISDSLVLRQIESTGAFNPCRAYRFPYDWQRDNWVAVRKTDQAVRGYLRVFSGTRTKPLDCLVGNHGVRQGLALNLDMREASVRLEPQNAAPDESHKVKVPEGMMAPRCQFAGV
jgi:hypothetical protein